ncbi:MAG: putative sugar nucleotidyl transferase, partial [Bacteroidota bacterium]
MPYLIFEDSLRVDLLPITFSRPAFMIRMGIFTSKERWEKVLGSSCYPLAYSYLQSLYTEPFRADTYICINGRLLPSDELLRLAGELAPKKYYTDAEGHILLTSISLDDQTLPPKGLITRD